MGGWSQASDPGWFHSSPNAFPNPNHHVKLSALTYSAACRADVVDFNNGYKYASLLESKPFSHVTVEVGSISAIPESKLAS